MKIGWVYTLYIYFRMESWWKRANEIDNTNTHTHTHGSLHIYSGCLAIFCSAHINFHLNSSIPFSGECLGLSYRHVTLLKVKGSHSRFLIESPPALHRTVIRTRLFRAKGNTSNHICHYMSKFAGNIPPFSHSAFGICWMHKKYCQTEQQRDKAKEKIERRRWI